jgi:hypothetical protein
MPAVFPLCNGLLHRALILLFDHLRFLYNREVRCADGLERQLPRSLEPNKGYLPL